MEASNTQFLYSVTGLTKDDWKERTMKLITTFVMATIIIGSFITVVMFTDDVDIFQSLYVGAVIGIVMSTFCMVIVANKNYFFYGSIFITDQQINEVEQNGSI